MESERSIEPAKREIGVGSMTLNGERRFGFASNMTCLSLCVRQAVSANRFGGTIGGVMMVAWAGMASVSGRRRYDGSGVWIEHDSHPLEPWRS
jgi:hypothetical protein